MKDIGAMFTPELLMQMAIEAENDYEKTPKRELDSVERRREEAFNTALWMEQHGVAEAASIGPLGNLDLYPGDKVRIEVGAEIGTPNGPETVSSSIEVELCGVDPGFVIDLGDGRLSLRNQRVLWYDKTGACQWTEASNVVIVEIAPRMTNADAMTASEKAQFPDAAL